MEKIWETGKRKLTLNVAIKCQGACRFRVVAEDLNPNSRYVDREVECDGFMMVELKFPVSPEKLKISVEVAKSSKNTSDFLVSIEEVPLVTYNVFLDQEVKDYLDICIPFCQISGYSQTRPGGRLYTGGDRKFRFKYFPIIVDFLTKKPLSTPARIGHNTGIIEISKLSFDRYTIPMRLIILLHEFSHKYRNPKIGLPIGHESGADINALYIYLGLGFSKVDAIYVFANVFLKAQTDGNIRRMRKITQYVARFEKEEYCQKN